MSTPVSILAAGLTCPAGKDFASATEAYARGERFLERERGLVMADGRPPTIAPVYGFTDERDYPERLRKLLVSALEDCLAQLSLQGRDQTDNSMLLLLPFWMEGSEVFGVFESRLEESPLPGVARLAYLFGGNAEGLELVGREGPSAVRTSGRPVLVAAVDSYLHANIFDGLAYYGQLLTRDNPYGMVPGEAACVLALGQEDEGRLGRVARMSMMSEPSSRSDPDRGVMGRALSNCYGSLLQGGFSPDRFIVDLNGDRVRSEEFGYAIAANAPAMTELADLAEVPTLQLGDLGAASGLVMTALALGSGPETDKEAGSGLNYSLLSASSDDGLRAATIVERVQSIRVAA